RLSLCFTNHILSTRCCCLRFFLIIHPSPLSTLFPYTTLFRSILSYTLSWLVSLRLLSFVLLGSCNLSLISASVPELICITKTVSLGSLAFCTITRFAALNVRLPSALFVLDWTLSIFLLAGLHFALRVYKA